MALLLLRVGRKPQAGGGGKRSEKNPPEGIFSRREKEERGMAAGDNSFFFSTSLHSQCFPEHYISRGDGGGISTLRFLHVMSFGWGDFSSLMRGRKKGRDYLTSVWVWEMGRRRRRVKNIWGVCKRECQGRGRYFSCSKSPTRRYFLG